MEDSSDFKGSQQSSSTLAIPTCVLSFALFAACNAPSSQQGNAAPKPNTPTVESATPPGSDARAANHPEPWPHPGTALIAASLFPSGHIRIDQVALKPIRWTKQSAPFHTARHAPAARSSAPNPGHAASPQPVSTGSEPGSPTLRGMAPGAAVGTSLALPSPGDTVGHALDGGAGAIVIRHPSQPEPFVTPIAWGSPGEGGGDVADRWQGGSSIWRAPYFGAGTRYSIVRTSPGNPTILDEFTSGGTP